MKYTAELIKEQYNRGEKPEFLFFWGHSAQPGVVKKSCFSQWYACSFAVDGVMYHTAEQYMMAQKALLFGDREIFDRIMAADNPKTYKALGRKVRGFDAAKWDAGKFEIVKAGNVAKFSQNPELKAFLLHTGDQILVEASPYDGIWGVGLSMDAPEIWDPNCWRGENLLGFALMEVRDHLREEDSEI